jgi:hypothetical protein
MMLKKSIKRLVRGCMYSEEYGDHPGTEYLIILTIFGGIVAGFSGALVMFVLNGIPYLMGAWDRGDY